MKNAKRLVKQGGSSRKETATPRNEDEQLPRVIPLEADDDALLNDSQGSENELEVKLQRNSSGLAGKENLMIKKESTQSGPSPPKLNKVESRFGLKKKSLGLIKINSIATPKSAMGAPVAAPKRNDSVFDRLNNKTTAFQRKQSGNGFGMRQPKKENNSALGFRRPTNVVKTLGNSESASSLGFHAGKVN